MVRIGWIWRTKQMMEEQQNMSFTKVKSTTLIMYRHACGWPHVFHEKRLLWGGALSGNGEGCQPFLSMLFCAVFLLFPPTFQNYAAFKNGGKQKLQRWFSVVKWYRGLTPFSLCCDPIQIMLPTAVSHNETDTRVGFKGIIKITSTLALRYQYSIMRVPIKWVHSPSLLSLDWTDKLNLRAKTAMEKWHFSFKVNIY